MRKFPRIPASFFGIVLGLAGLGKCWIAAEMAWDVPDFFSQIILAATVFVWAILMALYIAKWLVARDEALAEIHHPVQGCFIGLGGIATLLVSIAIAPHARDLALVLFGIGGLGTFAYSVYFTGRRWMGTLDTGATSPALYLPSVAGNFVIASVSGYFGHEDWGALFFGMGMLSWLALESVVSYRLFFEPGMPLTMRPLITIMLAPPGIACVAYLSITGGIKGDKPDLFAHALFGYGLLQLFHLLRLLPWITCQPFAASYWSISFGMTNLALISIQFILRGQTGYIEWVSVVLLLLANLTVFMLVGGTVWLLLQGKLLPPPLAVTPKQGPGNQGHPQIQQPS